MLIARLRCEAAEEAFDFRSIGMEWLSPEDQVCARTESGQDIRASDVLFAAIILLWSEMKEKAEMLEVHPSVIVARLGLGLALSDPSDC